MLLAGVLKVDDPGRGRYLEERLLRVFNCWCRYFMTLASCIGTGNHADSSAYWVQDTEDTSDQGDSMQVSPSRRLALILESSGCGRSSCHRLRRVLAAFNDEFERR